MKNKTFLHNPNPWTGNLHVEIKYRMMSNSELGIDYLEKRGSRQAGPCLVKHAKLVREKMQSLLGRREKEMKMDAQQFL